MRAGATDLEDFMTSMRVMAACVGFAATMMATGVAGAGENLGARLVDQMNALYGAHPHVRANHATGAVFEGMFTPAPGADTLSSAAFLAGPPTPLTIRFSNAGGKPDAADTDPSVGGIRGMATKFRLANGGENDIVAISANGFPVATGEDFLAFLQAVGASGAGAPQPTPLEQFLSSHPAAKAFVTAPKPVAVSYGTQPFFGVNALKFTNAQGVSKLGRYRIVPESGAAYVSDEEAARRPGTALADNLRAAVEKGPVKFRLFVQLAAPGDPTADATKVWPDSRPTIELGEIAITRALDTKRIENTLLFMPTNLTKGIDVSDDPILETRTEAYGESYARRTK
jgi:catalase